MNRADASKFSPRPHPRPATQEELDAMGISETIARRRNRRNEMANNDELRERIQLLTRIKELEDEISWDTVEHLEERARLLTTIAEHDGEDWEPIEDLQERADLLARIKDSQ